MCDFEAKYKQKIKITRRVRIECQNEGLSRTFEIDLIPVFKALIHNQNVNKIKMNC